MKNGALKGLIQLLENPGKCLLFIVSTMLLAWVIGVFHGDDLMEKYRLGENIGAVAIGTFFGWLIGRKNAR